VTTAWVVPTARATSWSALVAATGCLAGTIVVAAYADAWPAGLLGLAAAAVAAGVVAGLRDPAAALLAAVPTSTAVRRLRRLSLLVPAGLAVWIVWIGVGHRWAPGLGWPLDALAALTATGLAVAVWAPERIGVASGAALPLAWVLAARAEGALDEDQAGVLFAWQHHPEIVTVAALAALWLGRNRP